MKHIKTIILVVAIFSFLSFQQTKDSLFGKWELFKIETTDGEVKEISGRWMEFYKDGVLKGGNSLETTDRTGTWTYNEDTKELSFGSEKNLPGEGTYVITWMDAKTISFNAERDMKIFLKRIE